MNREGSAGTDLSQRLAALSPEQRTLLQVRLRDGGLALPEAENIPRRVSAVAAPLSFAQQRLWFIEQLEPGTNAYNVSKAIRLAGPLQADWLRDGLGEIVRRHEALRTTFAAPQGHPVQVIASTLDVPLPITDLSALSEREREAEAQRVTREHARRPFDIARGPLLRASLLRLGAEDHLLLLSMHHLICDGWSMGVLFRELGLLYQAFSQGDTAPLPELPIQYADYAVWQRRWLEGEMLERELAYWRTKLEGAPASLALPTDYPRPAVQRYRGAKESVVLPTSLGLRLHALAQREGVTLFMTLLAAFQALLARYAGQDDIVVGSPIAGRGRSETEGLVGLFMNTLALRTDLSGDPTFRELLGRVREVALGAYSHQDLPFEKLVEEVRPERSLTHSPLFQVMFVLHNTPRSGFSLPGFTVQPLALESGVAKYDLTLVARVAESGLRLKLEYNTDLFGAATITRMHGHFRTLLEACVSDPDRRLSDLPLLTDAERHRQLVEWNATEADYDRQATVQALFEEQVALTPNAVAVVGGGEELTYGELDRRANQLARYLRASGVGPEVRVGICLERSPRLLVGLLGILKAGGVYLPLDPGYPAARLSFMLADAKVPLLVTQARVRDQLPPSDATVVCLDIDADRIARESSERVDGGVTGDHLAYVIYTSGSTGRPKGVQVPHRAVVNFLTSMQKVPGLARQDTLLAVTTLAFDIAGLELLLPLTVGARVVIATSDVAKDGRRLADALSQSGATVMQATPAGWHLLVESGWTGTPGLRALCGGEALPSTLADELLARGASLWNMYGPTETTIWSAAGPVRSGAPIEIGRPIANTQFYLLDPRLQPVPIGVPGEFFIAGSGLARGYLNQPGLTAERFLPDPFSGVPGARMYRTGDLMRYRPDGSLEFLGRTDHQVKLRGFRIELGEIEAVLAQHPAVRHAVVLAREDTPGDKRLIAWVVPAPGDPPTIGELRGHLQRHLPEHMLPSAIVLLDAIPLTPGGKLDRAALPAPDRSRPDLAASYVAPRTSVEQMLADLWAALLGVEQVGVRDNFFELGGHSLLATLMMARVQAAAGVELPLRALFEDPTVEGIARRIEAIHQMVEEIARMDPGELQTHISAESVDGVLRDGVPYV